MSFVYTVGPKLTGVFFLAEQETGTARLVPRHSDLSHSDYSLIQCSERESFLEESLQNTLHC